MSITFILKKSKKVLVDRFHNSNFVEKAVKFSIFTYVGTFLICNFLSMAFGNKKYTPFFNVISDLGLNRYNPIPIIFDIACVATGLSLIPFSFYLLYILRKEIEDNRLIRNVRLVRICNHIAFISSMAANIGFIGVGIFSLERNYLGIHDYSAGTILLGFSFLTFSMGLLIMRYKVIIPSLFGICGFLTAFIMLLIYMIFRYTNFQIAPIYEWIWLFSVIFWTWAFIFYILKKSKFFTNQYFIHTYIIPRQFIKKN
ncbi:MAG: hypothetical protein JXA99_15985, partial [Candidatus Lokiarchaeota archaeon]|nr:hypothetical protein [Candidatus Lokiarchaeota archaeon]